MAVEISGLEAKAHELLGLLGPSKLAAVVKLLEVMIHDDDEEPVTDEDRRRFHEGQAWFSQHGGKGIPMGDVLAELGMNHEARRLSANQIMLLHLVEWLDEAQADVLRLGYRPTATRVFQGIQHFATTGGGDVSPLHGNMAGTLRLRVGDYSVLFNRHEGVMRIFGVRHRSETYR